MTQLSVPMSGPDITAAEIEAVNQVLQTPYLSIGPRMDEFEERFAAYIGARHAVGVSSGTAGLHLCIIAVGVSEGDLVITTPFSFVASANVILYERAIPVFVDIDPKTLNIDPALVAQAADDLARGGVAANRWLPPALRDHPTSTPSTTLRTGFHPFGWAQGRPLSSILPVHAFGQPADMDPILEVAREYDLAVIEDACEAVGAGYKNRRIGTQHATRNTQHATVFAFYPNKQMTTGEGGMIVTERDDWDVLFRSLRNQGRDVFETWFNHTRLGYNYRLDEMSAALGLAQLGRIEELLAKRERVAQMYNQRLTDVEFVETPYIAPTTTCMSWFVYVIRLAPEINRNAVMAAFRERGIPSRPYFNPIHLQPFYREMFGHEEGDFPITESVARSTLALPFYGNLEEEMIDFVCESLKEIVGWSSTKHP